MEWIGYISALFIGISLGLIGGGGSILTVPVLVYLFGLSPLVATSYSLFVVGSTSLVGSLHNFRKGWVHFRTVALFGLSSILTVWLIRKLLIPQIPPQISIGGWSIPFTFLTMVLFALLMLASSLSMIRTVSGQPKEEVKKRSTGVLFIYGIWVGLITGFLGAGGGFLLIPALVLLLDMPMRMAIGTSLTIIALNSLMGFIADIGHYDTDWSLLGQVSAIAIIGVLLGGSINRSIRGESLKRGFGWFVLAMGLFILVHEILRFSWDASVYSAFLFSSFR